VRSRVALLGGDGTPSNSRVYVASRNTLSYLTLMIVPIEDANFWVTCPGVERLPGEATGGPCVC
jgi:hypothetical protein